MRAEILNMQLAVIDTITEDFSSFVEVPAPHASIDAVVEFAHARDVMAIEIDNGVEWELGEAINEASGGLVRSR